MSAKKKLSDRIRVFSHLMFQLRMTLQHEIFEVKTDARILKYVQHEI